MICPDAPLRLDAAHFARWGERLALFGKTDKMTYAALGARAQRVADALHTQGVTPGEPVALVSSGRALDEPTGLLGIIFRGAVVVPLDATAPPARWAAIAKARGVRVFVHDEPARSVVDKASELLGETVARVCLNGTGDVVETVPGKMSAGENQLDPSLACILHTSGTTGGPKPVPIRWAGLDAFTAFMIELVGLSEQDRVLRVAELVFDLSWFDHIATWRAGATLCTMARRDLASGKALLGAMKWLEPTVVYGVPSMFMKLGTVCGETELRPAPRAILYAGEVFPPRELLGFAAKVPESRIWNLYGPTETNVCTFYEVNRENLDGNTETPIGLACPYARSWLVDENDRSRIIEGEGIGELVIEGPTTVGGGPYATGDRVERKGDGLYYFRGRIDRMVKIRGYRVEPGEVEAALDKHENVRQAAVIVHDDERLGKTLWAFVAVGENAAGVDERALRGFLAEVLPGYMVPERVILLEDLPRTVTGKVDYGALKEKQACGDA